MKSRMYGVLAASVGAMALMLAANDAVAASRAMSHGGAHLASHRLAGHFRHHHHHRGPLDTFVWPGDGPFYGPTGEAILDGTPPLPGDVRSSNASDIPWDWAHRYPPILTPSGRPYVSTCGTETMTVPSESGGTGQVNIVRCY
jgi:hypothetical protein